MNTTKIFNTFSIFFIVGRRCCNPTTFLSTPVGLGEREVPGTWDAKLACEIGIFYTVRNLTKPCKYELYINPKATHLETPLQCTRSWWRRAQRRRAWVRWRWWGCSCPPAWGWREGYSTVFPLPAPRTERSTRSRSRTPPETRGSEERQAGAFSASGQAHIAHSTGHGFI